jgi:hypothetical protein
MAWDGLSPVYSDKGEPHKIHPKVRTGISTRHRSRKMTFPHQVPACLSRVFRASPSGTWGQGGADRFCCGLCSPHSKEGVTGTLVPVQEGEQEAALGLCSGNSARQRFSARGFPRCVSVETSLLFDHAPIPVANFRRRNRVKLSVCLARIVLKCCVQFSEFARHIFSKIRLQPFVKNKFGIGCARVDLHDPPTSRIAPAIARTRFFGWGVQ